jgi:type IV pilus assembly protein PilW
MSRFMRALRVKGRLCRTSGNHRGFSLVELMVSVTIGLLILAAMVALFVNTSGSNREMARANSVIENGRLAIQLVESDIVHAGFWDSHVPQFDDLTTVGIPGDVPAAVPDPCLPYTTPWTAAYKNSLIGIAVQAYDAVSVCGGVILDQQPGTDILIVRHAETCLPGAPIGAGNCEADDPAKLYLQASRCSDDAPILYVFGDSGFTLHKRNCTNIADKRKFVSSIYYIRDYAVTAGDGIPTLMRSQFDLVAGVPAHQPAVPMIEGIEGFSVELGIDNFSKTDPPVEVDYTAEIDWEDPSTRTTPINRGDGAPDGAFIRCTTAVPCTVDQLINVTALKLYLLVKSREESPGYTDTKTYTLGGGATLGPFDDRFKRHLFVTTMRLPNVAGRRETPDPPPPPP